MRCQQLADQRGITKIASYKNVALITLQGRKIFEIARIGEVVKIDDRLARLGKPVKES